MSALEGIAPAVALLGSGSLYEFETEHGIVVMHEVDCVGLIYTPQP